MELTYDNMMQFMEHYFKSYSKYVNNDDEIDKLDELYAPEFSSTIFMHIEGKEYPFVRSGRQAFKDSVRETHKYMLETLFHRDIIIDANKKVAGVLLTSEKTDRKTGEKFVFDGIGFYQLRVDESDSIKVSDLRIFCDDPDKMSRVYFRSV